MEINTYNESDLHSTLKKIYALESNGNMEVKLDDTPWICDIMAEDGSIIEIQTSNLSALTEKASYILETGRKLKIIHPIAAVKWIELYDGKGKLLHRKKSPKKMTIFDSLRSMTQICPLFLHENCTLEILTCEITEMRRETQTPCQTTNKSRRHLKNWLPMGKRLDKIIKKERFSEKEDWLKLLPEDLRKSSNEKEVPLTFRTCDLQKALKSAHGEKLSRWAALLIWIFAKMKILEAKEIKGRSKFYAISA
ncbi:hypothetical protein [uncultured Treponema sp.]|uniref:hypothetical protein n=1 Tax=uncultured Treponema sp. TaxID=162155 RepID=UPI0025D207F5|nr:hypothetical protein [uncultured Treponema sp.]